MKIVKEDSVVIGYDFTSKNIQRYMERVVNIKEMLYIKKDNRDINAKSIIGLISANLTKGDIVDIAVFGEDYIVDESMSVFKEMLCDLNGD